MKEQNLINKIESQAKIFKYRVSKDLSDGKRHDLVKRDEKEAMWKARKRLGWSDTTIGSYFNRDPRTVKRVLEYYKPTSNSIIPSLRIGSARNTIFTDRLDHAGFVSLEVSAGGGIEAKGCWGRVKVLPAGPSLPLHWRWTIFTVEQTDASRIIIPDEKPANLDVAVALPFSKVTDGSLQAEPCMEVPVFFTGSTPQTPWNGKGCWLAQPSALENPDPRLEAYLTPGVYTINVTVGCDGGEGDSRDFILRSPDSWKDLSLVPK